MMSRSTISVHAARFLELIDDLTDKHQHVVKRAQHLAKNLSDPCSASPDACWQVIWSKPMHAAKNGKTAGELVRKASQILGVAGIWKSMSAKSGDFEISREEKGGIRRESYTPAGQCAKDLDNIGIPRHMIYRVVNAGEALANRAQKQTAPYADICVVDRLTVEKLIEEFGSGWGGATVLHLLTDFGVAIKPDTHVLKTCEFLGHPAVRGDRIDQGLQVTSFAKDLACEIFGSASPQNLRMTDKFLMEVSRKGLIKARVNAKSDRISQHAP